MIQARAPALRLASTFAGRRGDRELAHGCAGALATWASHFGSADSLAALAHALGEVALLEGEAVRAADHFGEALDRMVELDAPFERAVTQMRAGVALVASRRAGARRRSPRRRLPHVSQAPRPPACPLVAADLEAIGEPVDRRLGRVAAGRLERGRLSPGASSRCCGWSPSAGRTRRSHASSS